MTNKWTQYAIMAFETSKSYLIRRWNFLLAIKKKKQPFALFFVQQSQKKLDLKKKNNLNNN